MKKQISPTIIGGLAVVALLLCGTGLTKAEPHHNLAHQIEAELAQIEIEALLDKYRELTKRIHQLEINRAELSIELDTAQGEEERAELDLHYVRAVKTHDLMLKVRQQTREKLQRLAKELTPREHGEERERHRENAGLEERLHHLERQIEELREVGKFDRAEHLEDQANEIREHFANRERRGREGRGERGHAQAELREHFEHLKAERREATAHFEELMGAAKHVDGDGEEAQAKRHKLEDRAAEVKAHLGALNEQLEELEHAIRERRQGREREERRERDEDEVREREE